MKSYVCITKLKYYNYLMTMYMQFLNIDLFLYYSNATERGSSGSPILKEVDGRLKLVGLHREGDEDYNWGSLFSEIINHIQNKQLQHSKETISKLTNNK